MSRLRPIRLWLAGAGAVLALAIPSAAAVGQLFRDETPAPKTGSACALMVTRALDFARHYPVAARQYAGAGAAAGLPRLASSEEIRRCGNPERLIERVGVRAPANKAPAAKTGTTGP